MSRQLSREEQEAVLCLLSVRSHHKRPSDKDGGSDGFDDASLCGTRSKAQFRPSEDINDTKTTTGYPDRVSRYLNQTEQLLTPVTMVDHSARTMMRRRIPPAINKKKKKKMMVCVCGAIILVRTEWKHKQSNKHIQFMLKNGLHDEAQRTDINDPILHIQQFSEQQQQQQQQQQQYNKSSNQMESLQPQDHRRAVVGTTVDVNDQQQPPQTTTQQQESTLSTERTVPSRIPQHFSFQPGSSVSNGQQQQVNHSVRESFYHSESVHLSQMPNPFQLLGQQPDLLQHCTWPAGGGNFHTGSTRQPMYYIVLPQQQQQQPQTYQWQRIQMGFFDRGYSSNSANYFEFPNNSFG